MIKYKDKTFVCHLDLGMDALRGKWKSVILCHLTEDPIRFLELQRRVIGISHKVLNEQLKALEEEELISKKVYSEASPRVEYYLTKKGNDILPALKIIENWSKTYLEKEIEYID